MQNIEAGPEEVGSRQESIDEAKTGLDPEAKSPEEIRQSAKAAFEKARKAKDARIQQPKPDTESDLKNDRPFLRTANEDFTKTAKDVEEEEKRAA
ncbi:MAG TPA: hypothetical protein VJJ80_02890 [Patescibacteria group bacterium]|nr:hypothetical protein [Patescibacteria group bacterium]